MDTKNPCGFEKLLTKNVAHIHEKILLSLDYKTFKNCKGVCRAWDELLTSEAFGKKAKYLYYYEIKREKWKNTLIRENSYLTWFSEMGNANKVRQLLSHGVNPNCYHTYLNGWSLTPLSAAAKSGNTDVVQLLLEAGADPDRDLLQNSPGLPSPARTPLMLAAQRGHKDVVRVLLESGANPNRADGTDLSPLYWASIFGRKEVAKILIDAGAEINRVYWGGKTPLKWAAHNGQQDVVELLRNAGADEGLK